MNGYQHGLGRIYEPDDRDLRFPMSAVLADVEPPIRRYWYANSIWLDQGEAPHCVEYAWHHWASDGPVIQARGQLWQPGLVYAEAQREDEIPSEDYDGTTVRGGAKVLQRLGYISSYHWAWDLPTVIHALRTTGPVVAGTLWYSSMFFPNARGEVRIPAVASPVGGHAWLLDGVNVAKGEVRAKNSWGRGWGDRGFFRMSFDTLERLIHEDGEMCLAVEARPVVLADRV